MPLLELPQLRVPVCFAAVAKETPYVHIAMDEQALDHVKAQKTAGTSDENFHAYTSG